MTFTDEEREENSRLLKQELKQVDYLKEFKALGVDINITNGRQFSLVCNLVRNDRLIAAFDMGQLSYPVKQNNGNTINIGYKKENLEEQLKTNSPFIPHEVRRELDIFLYTCKHEPIDTNPLYSKEEKVMHKMNNLNNKNNELMSEYNKISDEGRLLEVLENLPFLKSSMKGSDLNQAFNCTRFTPNDNYHKFIISVKDGESNLIIREAEKNGKTGYAAAIMSYQDGLYSLQEFKPLQKLDRELLREVLSRPNPLLEADMEVEPEAVKSNVVPFEKPQEEVDQDEADYEDDEPDEPEVTQKKRHKLKR